MSKSIHFVGCGSANLFAILWLLSKEYNGHDIIVIDKGKAPEDRDKSREGMLFGFAGAGLWSDGKLVFSPHKDLTTTSDFNKKECHEFIRNTVSHFVKGLSYNVNNPTDVDIDLHGLELRQSSVIHLGTDTNVEFGKRVYKYMRERHVRFYWETEIVEVDLNNKFMVGVGEHEEQLIFNFEAVQFGVGKTAVDFTKDICKKHELASRSGVANIGGRFETPYNDKIKHVAENIQYDFKFHKEYMAGTSIRTFCVNNASAYVIEEPIKHKDRLIMSYNGHAYGLDSPKANGMTNFGIMMRVTNVAADEIHNKLLERFGEQGVAVLGEDADFNHTADQFFTPISWEAFNELYDSVVPNASVMFKDFIGKLNKVLNFGKNYVFYLPEIKMASDTILVDDNYREMTGRYPYATFVGDNCTGSVGVVPSAVTGIMGVKGLIS